MEDRCYSINVEVNKKYNQNSDKKPFITMRTLFNEGKLDKLCFGANHEIIKQELDNALDIFQALVNQRLPSREIITKLQELDHMQYGNDIACNQIGLSVAKLYYQFLLDKNLAKSS